MKFLLWRHHQSILMKTIITALLLGIFSCKNLVSASVLLWPTNLHIHNQEKSIALWVENTGKTTQVLQARIYAWSLKDGQDQLVNQSNFMISPPIAKIAPGKKQLFRVVSRVPTPAAQQQNYRVILDEIPQKANAKRLDKETVYQGVQFQFRYSIPLFSYGQGLSNEARKKIELAAVGKQLSWKVGQKEGKKVLTVTNNGPYYVNIGQLNFANDPSAEGVGGYLLPNSSREWEFSGEIGQALYGRINGSELIQIGR